MKESKKDKRVFVAMSGGVDSSVAAALLKKHGYQVVGVFMRFWAESPKKENLCCSGRAERAARAVALKLKIPFFVFYFERDFKKAVVDYFLDEVAGSRTPNPCVICNKKIKFGLLLKRITALGGDFLATGHYAKLATSNKRQGKRKEKSLSHVTGRLSLFAAKDKNKDQSYFLYQLNQKQLRKIIFPLGNYTKDEVIKMAKKWRLPFYKNESFDLCFAAGDPRTFIKKYLKLKPGKILNLKGKELGVHQGLALYTIGQRKGLMISRGPWWVIKKDKRKNILYVSNNEKDLYSSWLFVKKINWIAGQPPKLPIKVLVKVRYRSQPAQAIISKVGGHKTQKIMVRFKKPQRAITSGQSAVLYKRNEVIGGGIIYEDI